MQTLRMSRHDPHVIYLQRLLNEYFSHVPHGDILVEDNVFGRQTDAALRRFQTDYRGPEGQLVVDGVAGPKTWRALGLQTEISYPMPMVGQNTSMSCWVVSGGLASGRNASVTPAASRYDPVDVTYADGHAGGGLDPDLDNLEVFAREIGMRLLPMVPMEVEQLLPHVRRGPVLLVGEYVGGGLHAVVISGYFGGASSFSRMIRVNNPAPMGRGSIEVCDYPTMSLNNSPFDPYALIVR